MNRTPGPDRRMPQAELAATTADVLRRLLGAPAHEAGPLVVAISGGLDSTVLAHLLRFGTHPRPTLVLAHFDHAMRPSSAADAAWLRGVARAWKVDVHTARAAAAPASEDAARDARYAFLEGVRARVGARWILTAHHADDQAETVLFRILRGTGIEGLRGMDALRATGPGSSGGEGGAALVRPLLGRWREELAAYAKAVGLRWRDDPTNRDAGYARNVIRHRILPVAEAGVAPGARRALVRLASVAREDEEAWAEVLPGLLRSLDWDGSGVDAASTAALGPALRGHVVRHLARRSGRVLDHATTARAVAFVAEAASGHGIPLGGGLQLRRELDRLVVVPEAAPAADAPLRIPGPGPGSGTARLGGRRVRVCWSPLGRAPEPGSAGTASTSVAPADRAHETVLPVEEIAFPLLVRGRRPGDRIEVWGGTRRVKRLLQDARVPSLERPRVPIVVDAGGRVLWVPGVAEWARAEPADGGPDRPGAERISIRVEEE